MSQGPSPNQETHNTLYRLYFFFVAAKNLRSKTSDPKTSDQKPPIKNLRSKTSDQKPPIKNLRSKTSDQKPPIKNLRSKTSDQKPPI